MSRVWGPDPVGSEPKGEPCVKDKGGDDSYFEYFRVAARGLLWRDWVGTPRAVSLRLIASYQRNSSSGQNRCPHPAGRNCSALGAGYIRRYGAVQGWALAAWVIATCGSAECYDNPDAGDCCGRR